MQFQPNRPTGSESPRVPNQECESAGIAGATPPDRRSYNDIKRLETWIGRKLPASYKEILQTFGKDAGDFMSDIDCFFPGVAILTESMRQFLEGTVKLPNDAFVFAQRYGAVLFFFRLGRKNPVVYRWSESQPKKFEECLKSVACLFSSELNIVERYGWKNIP